MFYTILKSLDWFFVFFFLAVNSFYFLLYLVSVPRLLRRIRELHIESPDHFLKSVSLPSISIIIPVFNEEKIIANSIHSIVQLKYPSKEVVVVNDGSTDQTLDILKKEFKLIEIPRLHRQELNTKEIKAIYSSKEVPGLLIIDKVNGGKGDALNAGLNVSESPLFLSVDADTLIEQDALLRMIRPFLTEEGIVAEGGTIRLLNGCEYKKGRVVAVNPPKNTLSGIQVVEYLRAFLYGRLGWDVFGGNLIISGAFGLFEKKEVVHCGGYLTDTVGEDIELTVAITKSLRKRTKKRASVFVPDPVAWTFAPDSLRQLGHQRERWHRALLETMYRHRDMFCNPKYGATGFIGMIYLVFAEMLEPIFEFAAYICIACSLYLGIIDWTFLFLFLGGAWGISILLSVLSIVLEIVSYNRYSLSKRLFKLVWLSILENVGYRQILSFWKLTAFYHFFKKSNVWR